MQGVHSHEYNHRHDHTHDHHEKEYQHEDNDGKKGMTTAKEGKPKTSNDEDFGKRLGFMSLIGLRL